MRADSREGMGKVEGTAQLGGKRDPGLSFDKKNQLSFCFVLRLPGATDKPNCQEEGGSLNNRTSLIGLRRFECL